MNTFERMEIAHRLLELRKVKKLSQQKLALLLSEQIDLINLSGDNGKAVVSQLERAARGLTIKFACAYAEVFDVTLDYIYGRIDTGKPEYKTVKVQTGLTDQAISNLSKHVSDMPEYQQILSDFIGHPHFHIMMISIYFYLKALQNTSDLECMVQFYTKRLETTRSGDDFYLAPSEIVEVRKLQYEKRFCEIVNDIIERMVKGSAEEESKR